jgi:deoxyadenosine/deoxycytidine kinase
MNTNDNMECISYSDMFGILSAVMFWGFITYLLNILDNNTKCNNNNNNNKQRKSPLIISIEGNIGTGKSTLIEKVQACFTEKYPGVKIGYIPEPVDVWTSVTDTNGMTILEKYYGDQHKYAFTFQMMAYISRLSIIRKALKEQDTDIIIMERSIFTDCEVFAKMLYHDGKIEEIEYNIYMKWFNEFIGDLPNIWHIYIQADPTVSAGRVLKRGRQGEIIPLSYLEQCHDYHENWLLKQQVSPTLLLDGNVEMDTDAYAEWLEKIANFIQINDLA